jgi:methyl-accepting chemotaxis protein WspA
MKSWSVRQRTIAGFSAVVLIMVGLSALAYVRLRGVAAQAAALDGDSVPGLDLVGRLQAVSVRIYNSAEQHVAEHDPEQIRQIVAYIQLKSTERLDLLKQYGPTITTSRGRELYEASKAALANYMVVRGQVLKLSADPKTKPEAAALLREQLAPLYDKLQDALMTEVDFNKANAFGDSERIRGAVAITETAMLVSLLLGLIIAVASGNLLVQAINQPLTQLVNAIETMRLGDFSERLKLVRDDEFGVMASGFIEMADSLQDLAEKTQQVAAGNLAIAVEPLGKRCLVDNGIEDIRLDVMLLAPLLREDVMNIDILAEEHRMIELLA